MSCSSRSSTSTAITKAFTLDGNANDAIAPSPDRLGQTIAHSKQHWDSLAQRAQSIHMGHDTVCLTDLLHRLPALPDNLQNIRTIGGQASWELKSSECKIRLPARTAEERRWKLSLPCGRPTLCSISGDDCFGYADSRINGVSVMFFGWTYILSMVLLEKQRIPMRYSRPPQTPTADPQESARDLPCLDLNIGKASADELQWWNALLAPGQGWRPAEKWRPPWTVAYKGNLRFRVTAEIVGDADLDNCSPPSSSQAVQFLSRFASLHDLDGQSSLALAMALTLPLHNQTMSEVQLPAPSSLARACSRSAPAPSIRREYENISYYMTLSSNPLFLASALWGIFWEPGVDSNLVSAWCSPIIRVVGPLVQSGNLELLAHIFALRRTNIAPLWYGVLACGRTKIFHAIIHFLRTLQAPIPCRPVPEVAVWTGSPQSFIDVCGSGPYLYEDQVSRVDIWRLRYECWNIDPSGIPFRNPPICPWPPFGTMGVGEAELPIRAHFECDRHRWDYSWWTWLMDDREEVVDRGFRAEDNSLVVYDVPRPDFIPTEQLTAANDMDNSASRRAVSDIFRWAVLEMEPSGKDIYDHPWVQARADLDMGQECVSEEEDDTATLSDDHIRHVEEWLATQTEPA